MTDVPDLDDGEDERSWFWRSCGFKMGTLMWAASALVLAGLPCLASYGLWPLRNRLAVAVPVGVAWFVLGRCVLPDPSLPGVIRSAADALAPLAS